MIEKIKSALSYVFGLAVVILGALLFNRNRKLQQAESELAKATADKEIAVNDQKYQDAKRRADDSGAEYERIRGDS